MAKEEMLGVPDREDNHKNCVFCKIVKRWEEWKESEEGKARFIYENDDFIVILDEKPRIDGDTLVISREAYDDIGVVPEGSENKKLFDALVKTTRLLKNLGAEKVYIMSMCEHWEPKEINSDWEKGKKPPKTTEHLHFHLLPRYKGMRKKELAQENIFTLPQNKDYTLKMLKAIRDKIFEKSS